jgi:dTDP-4-amino-4,6-dideoxygalactose transaminase
MIPFLDLKKDYQSLKPEIDNAVQRVLDSGWFLFGKEVDAFEKEFASFLKAKHCVAVANGTEALQISLMALNLKTGSEVVTAANTSSATAAAIVAAGLKPVFADVDKESFNLDPKRLEARITKKTAAILPVHLYGQPADLNPIIETAENHSLPIIEDACQAHGAEYQNKKAGTFGKTGCFSFFPTKNLSCYGDGGAIATQDSEIAEKLRLLRMYGWKQMQVSSSHGINSRLDEIQAAILRTKLKHLDQWNEKRQKIAFRYSKELKGIQTPKEMPECKHVYHLFVARSEKRDALREHLKQNGIGSQVHYPKTLTQQPAFAKFSSGKCPAAESLSKRIISLPLNPWLKEEEVSQVIKAVNSFKS